MDVGVVDCEDVREDAIVGSSIRSIIDWAIDRLRLGDKYILIMGESGSGKTTTLLLIMKRLARMGIPIAYINLYKELSLGNTRVINCPGNPNPKVLLVDDVDAVFIAPKMAQEFIKKLLDFPGSVMFTMTVPLLVSNDIDSLEPLIRMLRGSVKKKIEYSDGEIREFAKRLGVNVEHRSFKTPGMLLRHFGGGKVKDDSGVLADYDITI